MLWAPAWGFEGHTVPSVAPACLAVSVEVRCRPAHVQKKASGAGRAQVAGGVAAVSTVAAGEREDPGVPGALAAPQACH